MDDRLLVEGRLERLSELGDRSHLVVEQEGFTVGRLVSADVELLEAHLSPGSHLVGQTLRKVGFRNLYQVIVLAIRRGDVSFRTNLESIPLLPGDILLLQGQREKMNGLREDPDLNITIPDSLSVYKLEERFILVHIPEGSLLAGKTLSESRLGESYGLGVLGIIRAGKTQLIPNSDDILQEGDTLLVKGKQSDLQLVDGLKTLEIETQSPPDMSDLESEDIGLEEAVLSPHSTLAGKNLRELNFRFK